MTMENSALEKAQCIPHIEHSSMDAPLGIYKKQAKEEIKGFLVAFSDKNIEPPTESFLLKHCYLENDNYRGSNFPSTYTLRESIKDLRDNPVYVKREILESIKQAENNQFT